MAAFLCQDGVTERPWLDLPMPWYVRLLWWLLSFAQLPSSLALVPDGNRRWARRRGATPLEGHDKGIGPLEQVQAAALALGVKTVTVYICSVNNLMRSEDQINHMFNLTCRVCDSICKNWQFYHKRRWSVKFPGDLDLYPNTVHSREAKAELMTHQKSTNAQIFYCGAYHSRGQITRMALTLCHAVRDGLLEPGDISEDLIDRYNEIEDSPPVDCYLRTSGEQRLSDFLTWQSERAAIYYEPKNFPDFVPLDMFKMMLHYSASSSSRKRLEDCYAKARNPKEQTCGVEQRLREQNFLFWLETNRQAYLQRLARDEDDL